MRKRQVKQETLSDSIYSTELKTHSPSLFLPLLSSISNRQPIHTTATPLSSCSQENGLLFHQLLVRPGIEETEESKTNPNPKPPVETTNSMPRSRLRRRRSNGVPATKLFTWKNNHNDEPPSQSSVSRSPDGSGKISFDGLLWLNDCSPQLPWDLIVPDLFKLRSSLIGGPEPDAMSDELWRQLPNRAAFQDPRDDPALNRAEPVFSSLTTFSGFSKAFKTYLTRGRFAGLGLRQDLATIAIAQTSSKRSSSTMRDGSTIFVTCSFS